MSSLGIANEDVGGVGPSEKCWFSGGGVTGANAFIVAAIIAIISWGLWG